MAFHDNMAPSPERPSSKRKDGGEKRSPKKAKKLKRDEGQSSKQFENNREQLSERKYKKCHNPRPLSLQLTRSCKESLRPLPQPTHQVGTDTDTGHYMIG